jgi:hypothetical protein
MGKLLPVYDRSRVLQDWKCPRSRYWNYEYMGQGIAPATTSLELFMGIIVHDALAAIALATQHGLPVDIDELAGAAHKQMLDGLDDPTLPEEGRLFAKEQATLVEGMLRGFFRIRWPQLLAQYPRIVMTEAELMLTHDGLRFMSKPDLVMANDEETVYVEYKTTSSKKEGWVNSWQTAVQLHSTIRAIKQSQGIDVDAVLVQGLYKGYESYGKQSSPFCYAYIRKGHPPFSNDVISYNYAAGYRRTATWELEGGVKKWVEEMPEVILGDQFPQTAPIYIKDDLVNAFFQQRATREHEIAQAMSDILSNERAKEAGLDPVDADQSTDDILTKVFPQKFDQCVPSFGRECPYKRLCHGPNVDPLQSGFTWREPHHVPEVAYLKERNDESQS